MDWLGVYPITKLHDFLSSYELNVQNESKVDEINIDVRNQTELNLVGYEPKVYQIVKFGFDPALVAVFWVWGFSVRVF